MHKPQARVLVVDDNPEILTLVRDVLTAAGCEVATLSSPEEALARVVGGETFDVAVLDLEMPKLHGFALAERVVESSPDTQIVILTGHADVDAAVEALHIGVFDLLRKEQFDVGRFEGVVLSAAERSRLLRENRALMQRLSASLRLLEALQQVAVDRSAAPSVDGALQRVMSAAKGLCDAESARVILFTRGETPGVIFVERAAGEGTEALRGTRTRPGEGLLARVAENEEALRLERPEEQGAYDARLDDVPAHLTGFLCVPLRHGTVYGALALAGAKRPFTDADLEAVRRVAAQAAISLENVGFDDRVTNFFTHMGELLVSILDNAEASLRGHSRATAHFADLLTRRLGLPDAERRAVHFGALLHAVGKLSGDARVADLPREAETGGCTAACLEASAELLWPIAWWRDALPLIRAIGEHWDGSGQPLGLLQHDIPLGARALAIAEAFDVWRRQGDGGAQGALRQLESGAGRRFDPRLVRLFVAEYRARQDEIEAQMHGQ